MSLNPSGNGSGNALLEPFIASSLANFNFANFSRRPASCTSTSLPSSSASSCHSRATGAFNDAVGSYDRMVRPSGEKLLKLGGGAAVKDLPEIAPLDATLRLPPS